MNQIECGINKESIAHGLKGEGTPKYFEINQSSLGQLCMKMPDFFDPCVRREDAEILAGYLLGKKVIWNNELPNNKIRFVYNEDSECNKL